VTDLEVFNDIPLITENQKDKIIKNIPTYLDKKQKIGHSSSQTSLSLQTLNMIDESPLSRMKQCLTQIDRKYEALKEVHFECKRLELELTTLDPNNKIHLIRINEIKARLPTLRTNMSNALRLMGMFQDMYNAIQKNYNIPENWNEKDYEKQEYQNMVKKSFKLGFQEIISHNVISKSCVEYWEQLGIHPLDAENQLRIYIEETRKKIFGNSNLTINQFYE
jgi:hypothetical protein